MKNLIYKSLKLSFCIYVALKLSACSSLSPFGPTAEEEFLIQNRALAEVDPQAAQKNLSDYYARKQAESEARTQAMGQALMHWSQQQRGVSCQTYTDINNFTYTNCK